MKVGISQKDFAKKAGISLATLKNFEKGSPPTLKTVLQIFRAFGKIREFENLLIDPPISLKERFIKLSKEEIFNKPNLPINNVKINLSLPDKANKFNEAMNPYLNLQKEFAKRTKVIRDIQQDALRKRDKDE